MVLIVVLLVLKWTARLLQQTAEWLMLGWLNKLLGIALYCFIYFTMFSAVVYFLQILGVLEKEKVKEAFSYSYLQSWWPYCMGKIGEFIPSIKHSIATFSNPLK
jgi:membrane protein required for colicin V production